MSFLHAYASPTEITLFHWLNFDGGPALDAIGVALSDRRFGLSVGILLVAFLLFTKRVAAAKHIVGLVLAVGISDAIGARILRPIFGRMRPCYALGSDSVRWLAPAANLGSLPSLHAANLFAIALVASLADRRLAVPAYACAFAVAWSRIYVGAHWPSDVLAGAVWGAVAGAIAWITLLRAVARLHEHSARSS